MILDHLHDIFSLSTSRAKLVSLVETDEARSTLYTNLVKVRLL